MKNEEFKKAIELYTGNKFSPNIIDPKWIALIEKIDNSPYTPYEFCFYITFHHVKDLNNDTASHYLIRRNYLLKEEVWEDFISFKHTRMKEIQTIVKLQRESFSTKRLVYGNVDELLLNKDSEINPLMRIDLALQLKYEEDYNPDKVLEKYLEAAEFLVKGSPEYLDHCLLFKDYLKVKEREQKN